MKLLLTSNGLSNGAIATALQELVGKEPAKTTVAFIPTAANPQREDKEWLIRDLYNIHSHGYYVDILELTALTADQLHQALQKADVIFVGGGNTFYLSFWMQRMGLFTTIPKLLESKVYAGISAGSMVAGTSLVLSSQAQRNMQAFVDQDYDELGPPGQSSGKTMGLIDCIFRPHLNSRVFSLVREDILREKASQTGKRVYALDDNSALKVVDGKEEVVSEGQWVQIQPVPGSL